MANPPTVDELMHAAFDKPRTPRSDEYKAGVRAVLEFRIEGKPIRIPYHVGGAKADAFFAGQDEGHGIWRRATESEAAHA